MSKQDANAVVPAAPAAPTLRQYLDRPEVMGQVAKALPRGLRPEQLVRQALTLVGKTPKLADCTQRSILTGIMDAAQLGLELSGPLGHAFLVPRWNGKKRQNEATFQIGWKGLVKLAQQSGQVCELPARVVYANDRFLVKLGTEHRIEHDPAPGPRGEATHYYAIAFYQSGRYDFEVMSKEEVLAHRAKYSPPPKNGQDYSAWATAFDAMAKKTVIRALCYRLSLAPQAQRAAWVDDCRERGLDPDEPRQGFVPAAGSRAQEVLDHLDAVAPPEEATDSQPAEQPAE